MNIFEGLFYGPASRYFMLVANGNIIIRLSTKPWFDYEEEIKDGIPKNEDSYFYKYFL